MAADGLAKALEVDRLSHELNAPGSQGLFFVITGG
jgi:hypothetical protein